MQHPAIPSPVPAPLGARGLRPVGSLQLVDSLAALTVLLEPSVNACIVRRDLDPDVLDAMERVAGAPLDRAVDLDSAGAAQVLLAGLPPIAQHALATDLDTLYRVFSALTGRRAAHARLCAVSCDACRKFHVDYVGMRMLVTYAGPGTQIAPDPHARREHIGRAELSFDAANAAIVPDASHVVTARAGDVVVLKGEAFHLNAGRGAVHRSPPIEATGARRLLLKLDLPGCGC